MNYKFILAMVLVGAAVGYSLYSKKNLESQLAQESDLILTELPNAEFQTLEQDKFATADLMKDSPKGVFVHFWASWCGPCEAELPELIEFINSHGENVTFLIVAVNDELPKIRKFIAELKVQPNQSRVFWLMDNNSIHRDYFGTMKLPETFVFKSNGKILKKFVGPQEWLKPQFFDIFQPLSNPF